MLDLIGSGLVSFWLGAAGVQAKPLEAIELLALQSSPALVLAAAPHPAEVATIGQYLHGLETEGLGRANQGIWMQSGPMLMANNNGTVPLPAASLTKIATTLAALKTWRSDGHFETLVSATGPIANGVLQGDLVITGWRSFVCLGGGDRSW